MPIDRPRGRVRTGRRVALAVALAVLAAVGATPAVVGTVPAVAAEPPPTATSATPGHVSSAGGDVVTVRGTGLTAVTDVTVWGSGEHPVPAWTVVSDTELRLTTPRLVAGGTAVVLHTASSSVMTGARFVAQNITALPPTRALSLTRVVPGTPHCFPVKGRDGVHAEAEAVMLNITTVSPEGHGHVVVYPDVEGNGRTPAPWASTVNFVPGQDVANATFVGTTRHGDVCLLTRGAVTGLLVDVMGFQAPDGPFYLYNRPERTVDTRPGSTVGPVVGPLQPRTTYDAYTGYTDPSPSGGLALVNVTIPAPPAPGHLRMFARGTPVPDTSTANYLPGVDRATLALTPTSEHVSSFWSDSSRPAHVVVDHVGATSTWKPSTVSAGSSVQPSGRRVVDTRPGSRTGPFATALQAGTVYRLPVSALTDRPEESRSALLNVISVAPTAPGHLRVFGEAPGGRAGLPNASALNYIPGYDTSNLVLVDLPADGTVSFYSGQAPGGSTHLVVDVVAYAGSFPWMR